MNETGWYATLMKREYWGWLGAFMIMTARAAFSADAIPASEELGWQYQGEDGTGIKLWKKEVAGSPIVAFRGEAVIEASIPKIASVLGDSKRRVEWVADAKEAWDIRADSPVDRVEYNRTGAPWPVSDRDFVYRVTARVSREQKAMYIHIRSVEDPSVPPRQGVVRGELINSAYWLNAIDDHYTRVRVEIHADPKGDLPKWVVNLVQQNWPKTTLVRMGRQVAKPDVHENPVLRAYFDTGVAPAWAKGAEVKPLKKADRSEEGTPLRAKGA
jgi:hypothetical protein